MSRSATSFSGLRRLARPPAPAVAGQRPEVCEMCGVPIGEGHAHVADLEAQRLLCACRSCHLLFTGDGAGGRRFRALPEGSRRVADPVLSPLQWEALQIPVDLAFLFRRGDAPDFAACYPGPGGATESMLDLSSWAEVLAANPVLATVRPDVEAVLLRRRGGSVDCLLVPIDVCYSLVGLVRRHWTGFGGGAEVWERIEAFFDGLRERSTDVARTGEGVVP